MTDQQYIKLLQKTLEQEGGSMSAGALVGGAYSGGKKSSSWDNMTETERQIRLAKMAAGKARVKAEKYGDALLGSALLGAGKNFATMPEGSRKEAQRRKNNYEEDLDRRARQYMADLERVVLNVFQAEQIPPPTPLWTLKYVNNILRLIKSRIRDVEPLPPIALTRPISAKVPRRTKAQKAADVAIDVMESGITPQLAAIHRALWENMPVQEDEELAIEIEASMIPDPPPKARRTAAQRAAEKAQRDAIIAQQSERTADLLRNRVRIPTVRTSRGPMPVRPRGNPTVLEQGEAEILDRMLNRVADPQSGY